MTRAATKDIAVAAPKWRGRKPAPDTPVSQKRGGRPTLEQAKAALGQRKAFLLKQWPALLALIREGTHVTTALAEFGIDRSFLTKLLRDHEQTRAEWNEAKLQAVWKSWDLEVIEEILVKIALGGTLKDELDNRGLPRESFYKLVLRDPVVKELYDDAQKMRMEGMADEILEISDAAENDRDAMGRVDHEHIQRAKLRTDSRKWLMARLHHRRFGDRLQTEQEVRLVVDHASRLDAARKRKERVFQARNGSISDEEKAGAQDGELVERGELAELTELT